MTESRTTTTLRFVGDWPWWAGCSAALLLGALACWLYRAEVRSLSWLVRGALPVLRASAVGLMVLMLSGPVLRHRTVIGELSHLSLVVDGSRSMDFADPAMEPARKIRILERIGLLEKGAVALDLAEATEALGEAKAVAERVKTVKHADTSEWNAVLTEYAGKLAEAHEDLSTAGDIGVGRVESFARELVEPARALAGREMGEIADRERAISDLDQLGTTLERWRRETAAMFERRMEVAGSGPASQVRSALQKFETMPRWQRLQAQLLGESEEESLLSALARNHATELILLEGSEARTLWESTARDAVRPPLELPPPTAANTDLSAGLGGGPATSGDREQRGAIVLFTDGQHNDGRSPIEAAKVLAGRSLPVHTVGLGSVRRPSDLAVVKVEGPDSVYSADRLRGSVTLKDDMPPVQPFKLTVRDGDKVLWEQELKTDGRNLRSVPFDFPVSELASQKLAEQQARVETASVPVEVQVSVSALGGDRYTSNNDANLRFRTVTQRRKILLVDGRPRWETRYLRNMFERDEQWEVNAVIASSFARELGLARGDKPEQFPSDFAALSAYDIIIFGEVPRPMFKEEELQWLHDFVAQRGGAIVFIDGSRNYLQGYAATPVAPLLPVEWKGTPVQGGISSMALSERAQGMAPFALAPERAQNLETWKNLRAPHWLSGATALPGAEVLVHAQLEGQADTPAAAVVHRSFGAGNVLYHAFDESWRWRYEVADQHHVRYWNQMANWIAELPFAVRDKFISLDAGRITYRPGESADLRVRLRDGEGRPVTGTVVDAVLFRDGKRVATTRLAPDENAGGLFRGRTAALEPGRYEVGVESVAISQRDSLARTEFKVEPREATELTQLSLNEELLQRVAGASGGQFLLEEQLPRLLDLLAPLAQGKVVETETVLWQSYWWFLLLVALLTLEWIIRKRVGLL